MSPELQVVADDLSGAAECAAVIAQAQGRAAPVVLRGALPAAGSWVVDTDARALSAAAGAAATADAFQQAAALRTGSEQQCLKIDSTLRGHVAGQVAAVLALPGLFAAAVVCPTLPAHGRSLQGGVLHLRGQPQADAAGAPIELLRMLSAAGLQPLLLQPAPHDTAEALSQSLVDALASGARALVVDAVTTEDLRRLAGAILNLRGERLLAAGSAALVQALATQRLQPATPAAAPALQAGGPVLALVGSFAAATTAQVDELARHHDVHVVRLDAPTWLSQPGVVAEALQGALAQAAAGDTVVLGVSGATPAASSRELVRCIADAARPLVDRAGVLLLTGGDTARVVLEQLGIARLEVLGELEPGICLSLDAGGTRHFVTKAGGFGDPAALVRVLRRFQPGPGAAALPAAECGA